MKPTMTAAPAAYVTLTPAPSTPARTRVRVTVSDDGPLPRLHLTLSTLAGDLDVALAPDEARLLAAGVTDGVELLAALFVATPAGAA